MRGPLLEDDLSTPRVRGIVEAWAFAAADPYRAATHNKGVMNGIDPVVIATGNDWRAIEAGAHAYAARSGRYTSLTTWGEDADSSLSGVIELPMAVGIVGGTTRAHPLAQVALKILDVHSARELAEVIAAVGLAQNLAALRALGVWERLARHAMLGVIPPLSYLDFLGLLALGMSMGQWLSLPMILAGLALIAWAYRPGR